MPSLLFTSSEATGVGDVLENACYVLDELVRLYGLALTPEQWEKLNPELEAVYRDLQSLRRMFQSS